MRGRNTALYTDYKISIADLCRPPTHLTRADGRLFSFLQKERVHKNAICDKGILLPSRILGRRLSRCRLKRFAKVENACVSR